MSYAYRSTKELVTGLELCLRLYPELCAKAAPLINEGDQIGRMLHTFMRRLGRRRPAADATDSS